MELGLYVHIPFCQSKCGYCDFNSYSRLEWLFEDYTAALAREMDGSGPAQVRTIYVGGGTPTVLPLSFLARILEGARRAFTVDPGAEVTVEANPGTVNVPRLAALRKLGVTRLSLGVQSFDQAELWLLGRGHSSAQAHQAFAAARRAGFDNVNLDLIFGLPGQTLPAWQASLAQAVALQPEHLALYALTVEEHTPLARSIAQGVLPMPDPDLGADMYELARRDLRAAGYLHYEISNWTRAPEHQCQHNLAYWRNEPYLGVGAGAHSWLGGRRWANIGTPTEYVARVLGGQCPLDSQETIDREMEIGETMMMGLRLVKEGVSFERFRTRFGLDLRQYFADELAQLLKLGLILAGDRRVRLSERGQLLGNQVFLAFLPG